MPWLKSETMIRNPQAEQLAKDAKKKANGKFMEMSIGVKTFTHDSKEAMKLKLPRAMTEIEVKEYAKARGYNDLQGYYDNAGKYHKK